MRLFFTLTILFLPVLLRAQTTYAVIVGVDVYRLEPARNNLRFSDDDARNFYQFLRSPVGGSVPGTNLLLLTGSRATHSNIVRALSLFACARPEDRVIFYFSGHGTPGAFVPHDFDPQTDRILTHQTVKAAFRASRARTKFCLADACFSGSIRTKPTQPTSAPGLDNAPNVVVFMASRPHELSVEMPRLGQGVFTHFLIKGLQGYADTDQDRQVSIYELYAYTRQGVGRLTGGRQTPIVYGRFPKDLILAQITP